MDRRKILDVGRIVATLFVMIRCGKRYGFSVWVVYVSGHAERGLKTSVCY